MPNCDDRGRKHSRKRIDSDPNFAKAYNNCVICYREQGKEARAQADFKKAKQLGYTGAGE
jgi:hypothetical protein